MLPNILSLLSLATIALASYALGRPIVRALGVAEEDRLAVTVWSVFAGLLAAGMLLAGLGLVGILYSPLIGVLSVAGCFWGIGQIVFEHGESDPNVARVSNVPTSQRHVGNVPRNMLAARAGGSLRETPATLKCSEYPRTPWAPPPRWVSRGVVLLAGLACLGSLVSAMAPPTAGDALCYHLELPKSFLADHVIRHLPYSENSTYPLLAEMWYLWGLALDGGVAAELVHWGLGLLLGLATVVLATPVVGRPWAWIAGALVILVPGVNNQMTAPLNDVALAVPTTLAMAAWWQGVVGGQGRRWFVLAGLAAGGALGTKYVAVLFVAAVAITSAWAFCRHPLRRKVLVEGAAIVSVVAASVAGLWYVRAAWYRGNPVYPFLSEVFASGADDPQDHETLPESKSPLGRSLSGAIVAPWQVTMHPERFGGRGHQLGVLFLAAMPAVLFTRRLRGLGALAAVGLVYFFLWYLLRQNVRFLLPVVPILSVVVVWVWIETGRFPRPSRGVAGATFAAVRAAIRPT
jgi:hypothetical protein